MDTKAVPNEAPDSTPKPQVNAAPQTPPAQPTDKYAVARLAKKKRRRAAHRAKIARSHANG